MTKKTVALLLTLALMVVGCSASGASTATGTTEETAAAEDSSASAGAAETQEIEGTESAGTAGAPSADVYPADYRTGISEVDAVIEAFLAKDVDGLTSCSMVNCQADDEGNLKPYVYFGSCQVNSLDDTWDSLRESLSAWTEDRTAERGYLYAAYRVQDDNPDVRDDLRWGYFLQFASDRNDSKAKAAVLNQEGKIVQLWLGCGEPKAPAGEGFEPIAPPRVEQ